MGYLKEQARQIYGNEPQTMDELGHAVIKILDNAFVNRYLDNGIMERINIKCVGLSWDLKHSKDVSHTHSSPEGFNTCWGGCKPKHEPYSGWHGRVWVRYNTDNWTGFGSDPFKITLTHTGSGGSGCYDGPWTTIAAKHFDRYGRGHDANMYPRPYILSWDYSIFDLDWPELIEIKELNKTIKNWKRTYLKKYDQEAMLAKLEGRWMNPPMEIPHPTHKFLWEDPETKANDEKFLADFRKVQHQQELVSLLR